MKTINIKRLDLSDKKMKIGFFLFSVSILLVVGAFAFKLSDSEPKYIRSDFLWGATIRPYATSPAGQPASLDNLDQQTRIVKDLFKSRAVARANIEGDNKLDDSIVEYSQKNDISLFLVLEKIKDFNQDLDYQKEAQDFAKPIVERYKGKVGYYQLSNELSGVVFQRPDENGETIDAGYGLKMNKKRYENVRAYVSEMSKIIRQTDPSAKIVISGHWVLIKPIQDLIKDGVEADIVGWNWGEDMGDQPGIKDIDNYGRMDLPKIVKDLGKKFWIVEANSNDGSSNDGEDRQADYIEKIARNAYANPDISAFLHFILTDSLDKGGAGNLGLLKIKDTGDKYVLGDRKKAYYSMLNVSNK